MQFLNYLASVPWRSYATLWRLRSRPYDAPQRFVCAQVHDKLHCAGFSLRSGRVGQPGAVWDVGYYSNFTVDQSSWSTMEFSLPRQWSDKYCTFLVESSAVHFENPSIQFENLVAASMRLDAYADNPRLRSVESWAEVNRVALELVTISGVVMSQAWFHQMRDWRPNEVRFLIGDDGLSLFVAVACEQGLLSFSPVRDVHELPALLMGYLQTLHQDEMEYVYTALVDTDWETIKMAFAGESALEKIFNESNKRVKTTFTGAHVPDLGPLRTLHPLLVNSFVASLPNWPLS